MSGMSLAPPWVLFIDKNKPVAILPAGRPGEVANVAHLSMKEAQNIVNLANQLFQAIAMAKLKGIEYELDEIGKKIRRM